MSLALTHMPSIAEAGAALDRNETSAEELTRHALDRAGAIAVLNAMSVLRPEEALAAARESDARRAAGRSLGPLDGLPVTVKDVLWVASWPAENGSRAFQGHVPRETNAAVARLLSAGAVLIGKTTNSELCFGSATDTAVNGRTLNPHHPDRSPGGSSGGSGASLAAGLGFAGLGTDDGGSIRIPAAFCGIVGFKASFGTVPRFPGWPQGLTSNTIGPMARSVADAAAVYRIIAGSHPSDMFAADPLPARTGEGSAKGLRLGYSVDLGRVPVTPSARAAFAVLLDRLTDAGAELVPFAPQVNSDLIYFDAMRPDMYAGWAGRVDPDALEPKTRAAFLEGKDDPARIYLSALYARETLYRDYLNILAETRADALLTPTLGFEAPRHDCPPENLPASDADCFGLVSDASLTGLPAIALPHARGSGGLPLSVQLTGKPKRDHDLLATAARVEAIIHAAPRIVVASTDHHGEGPQQ